MLDRNLYLAHPPICTYTLLAPQNIFSLPPHIYIYLLARPVIPLPLTLICPHTPRPPLYASAGHPRVRWTEGTDASSPPPPPRLLYLRPKVVFVHGAAATGADALYDTVWIRIPGYEYTGTRRVRSSLLTARIPNAIGTEGTREVRVLVHCVYSVFFFNFARCVRVQNIATYTLSYTL